MIMIPQIRDSHLEKSLSNDCMDKPAKMPTSISERKTRKPLLVCNDLGLDLGLGLGDVLQLQDMENPHYLGQRNQQGDDVKTDH